LLLAAGDFITPRSHQTVTLLSRTLATALSKFGEIRDIGNIRGIIDYIAAKRDINIFEQ
jgi:hypothetical protein